MRPVDLLQTRNGRLITFFLLYVSEGIPQGFALTAMVAYMRRQEISIDQIGVFAAALSLPWAFKWAWAPLVDLVKLNRFGGRKAWIIFCTLMMTLTLMSAAFVDFTANFNLLLVMLVISNAFGATQDIAIDSLAVSSLKEDERGRGAGFMFGGSAIGLALGGGGALYVSGLLGFNASLIYISGILCLNLLFIIFFVNDPDASNVRVIRATFSELANSLRRITLDIFYSFFNSGTGPKAGLIFMILPTGAVALGTVIASSMQVDYGLTDFQIGDVSVYSNVVFCGGCLFGGVLGDKYGIRRVMAIAYALTTIPTLFLAVNISASGLQDVPIASLYGAILSHSFVFGMCYGLAVAIVMRLTNPAVAATQFTAFMALANLAVAIGNFWQGKVAQDMGYAAVLYLDALIVVLPLMVIPFLRNREVTGDLAQELTHKPA